MALLNSLDDTPRPSDNTGSRKNFAPTREHAEKKLASLPDIAIYARLFFLHVCINIYVFETRKA